MTATFEAILPGHIATPLAMEVTAENGTDSLTDSRVGATTQQVMSELAISGCMLMVSITSTMATLVFLAHQTKRKRVDIALGPAFILQCALNLSYSFAAFSDLLSIGTFQDDFYTAKSIERRILPVPYAAMLVIYLPAIFFAHHSIICSAEELVKKQHSKTKGIYWITRRIELHWFLTIPTAIFAFFNQYSAWKAVAILHVAAVIGMISLPVLLMNTMPVKSKSKKVETVVFFLCSLGVIAGTIYHVVLAIVNTEAAYAAHIPSGERWLDQFRILPDVPCWITFCVYNELSVLMIAASMPPLRERQEPDDDEGSSEPRSSFLGRFGSPCSARAGDKEVASKMC